jgi:hypothetical protein
VSRIPFPLLRLRVLRLRVLVLDPFLAFAEPRDAEARVEVLFVPPERDVFALDRPDCALVRREDALAPFEPRLPVDRVRVEARPFLLGALVWDILSSSRFGSWCPTDYPKPEALTRMSEGIAAVRHPARRLKHSSKRGLAN